MADLVQADALILLSDIDGLYNDDPHTNPNAQLIHEVLTIDDAILKLSKGSLSNRGTGGMNTKIKAAQMTTALGIDLFIVQGADPTLLYDVLLGKEIGTYFHGHA